MVSKILCKLVFWTEKGELEEALLRGCGVINFGLLTSAIVRALA